MRFVTLLSLFLSGASLGQGRFDRFNQRADQGRSHRGFEQSSGAFFEFAPASGAGMGSACACAAVTGAKGETLTFTRTGNATCSKQGLATTGIANGDLVVCAGDQPRVESSGGVLGLRVEGARTNVLTRFIDYANGTWADVGTPTLTGSQASPWTGTYANLAVQFDDNDGAGFEGRTQTVTVTAATQYTMSCFVKAGTLSSWTLSLDGTTASGTGLSSTTWSLVSVTDASSSGVAIAAQALNGSTAAATGTIVWGGCQVEAGAYATSMTPTVATGVTRNAEAPYLTMLVTVSPRSWAATSTVPFALANVNNLLMDVRSGVGATDFVELFHRLGTANFGTYAIVSSSPQQVNGTVALGVPGTNRAASWYAPAGTLNVISNGTTESAATALGALPALDRVYLGTYVTTGAELNGIVSRVCVDPDSTRCR